MNNDADKKPKETKMKKYVLPLILILPIFLYLLIGYVAPIIMIIYMFCGLEGLLILTIKVIMVIMVIIGLILLIRRA